MSCHEYIGPYSIGIFLQKEASYLWSFKSSHQNLFLSVAHSVLLFKIVFSSLSLLLQILCSSLSATKSFILGRWGTSAAPRRISLPSLARRGGRRVELLCCRNLMQRHRPWGLLLVLWTTLGRCLWRPLTAALPVEATLAPRSFCGWAYAAVGSSAPLGAFCIDPTGTGIVLAATGTMRDNTLLNVNRVDHRDEESIINCVSTIFGRCFNCTGQVEPLCQLESIS